MKLPTLTNSENGFAHVLLIAVIVVVAGVAGFVGYSVLQNNKSNAGSTSTLGRTELATKCGAGYKLYKTAAKKDQDLSGELRVYSKGSGSSRNWCAFMVHTGKSEGVKMSTNVAIDACAGGQCKKVARDWDDYASYAGPVKFKHVTGNYTARYVSGQIWPGDSKIKHKYYELLVQIDF